jgi:phospholipid/cholesterol/gamma-HCH transport system substrate-binding protein
MLRKGQDRDAAVGALVLVAGALLFALVYGKEAHPTASAGYNLVARFNRADGVAVGTDVRMSGVVVGKVAAQSLDSQYNAVIELRIASNLGLPVDTAAAIQADGLLSSKYIELKPGAEEKVLGPGAEITYTQGSMVLEDLLELIINQARAKRGYLDRPLPSSRE